MEEILDSPVFWFGVFFFFVVLGKLIEIIATQEYPPKDKKKK